MSPRQAATRGDHPDFRLISSDVTIVALLLQLKLQHINQSLAIPARLALALPSPSCGNPQFAFIPNFCGSSRSDLICRQRPNLFAASLICLLD
ncbi:hypothetical protein B296_00032666 [Ensete ventricosum]|uniref:Uncharacterized protein n=1 Tax=Ensete ventricosum TaxID=4639 RepID=A0A426ZSB0_ENSVE|nr:hypothetical protein B296_00032666 [Ensete ventricosum]